MHTKVFCINFKYNDQLSNSKYDFKIQFSCHINYIVKIKRLLLDPTFVAKALI